MGLIMMNTVVVIVLFTATALAEKRKFPPNRVHELPEHEMKKLPAFPHNLAHSRSGIPEKFDARIRWPKCKSIRTIRDQGQCGTCWAVSSASVLSDRICIASNQHLTDVFISGAQSASCSQPTKSPIDNCQGGGDAQRVYKYAALYGVATGGEYDSGVGCVPYPVPPDQDPPIACVSSCSNHRYSIPLPKDNKIVDGYWANYKPSRMAMTQQQIDEVVSQMKFDIMVSGPLTATISVYDDFQDWADPKEPYCNPRPGSSNLGGHAVRIIGWGKTNRGVKYWIIANSWGTGVGVNGLYYIEMGKNCIGVERTISAPIVDIPNTCNTTSFCELPIDQAIQSIPTDIGSPVYLFQDNCVLQVSVDADGLMTAVGSAVPLNTQILGAPIGPITSYIVRNKQLWIINDKGEAGANCMIPNGAKKLSCGSGNGTPANVAQAVIPGDPINRWSYYATQPSFVFNTQGKGTYIGDLFNNAGYSSVQAMLNVDGQKAIVFGKDGAGKPITSLVAYPSDTQDQFSLVTTPAPLMAQMTSCENYAV